MNQIGGIEKQHLTTTVGVPSSPKWDFGIANLEPTAAQETQPGLFNAMGKDT
jgi:hypothetical protein